MIKNLVLCLVICLLLLTGCRGERLTADTLPWVSEEPILFSDDFTLQSGGWQTQEDRLSFIGYVQDGFRLWVDLPHYQVWSVPGLNFKDVHVYTRVQQTAGPNDNLVGLICRYRDEDNFYALMISSDGYFGITKKEAGVQSLVGLTELGFSEHIHRDGATNEILAICQGDQLALFANGINLLQVSDATFTYGDIGMIAGNRAQPGADFLFDYLIVMKP